MSVGEVVALVLVGALAGTAAASIMGWRKRRSGSLLRNTGIGILGALVGGLIFGLLDIDLGEFLSATISLADLISALVGAIIVILVIERVG